jgi:hypothetical protein
MKITASSAINPIRAPDMPDMCPDMLKMPILPPLSAPFHFESRIAAARMRIRRRQSAVK